MHWVWSVAVKPRILFDEEAEEGFRKLVHDGEEGLMLVVGLVDTHHVEINHTHVTISVL